MYLQQVGGGKNSAIGINKGRLICHSSPKYFRDGLVLCQQTNPVADNSVNNNIEYLRGKWVPLGNTTGTPEIFPTVSALPCRHGFPVQILGQELEELGDHTILLQDNNVTPLVQCVIGLVDIYKYLIKHFLPQDQNMLK